LGLLYYGQNFLIYPSAFPAGAREGACAPPPFHFFGCAGLTRVKLAPLSRIWVSHFLDVPVPTDFSIPYTDLELTTTDDVKIKAFLLLQRPNLGMNETQVASGEESGEEVWHLLHKATPLVPGN
jgi:abhydrolase domain-containing protein 13